MCKYCRRLKKQLLILRYAARLEPFTDDEIDRSLRLTKDARQRIKQAMKDFSSSDP
jgi:hypothetical protein